MSGISSSMYIGLTGIAELSSTYSVISMSAHCSTGIDVAYKYIIRHLSVFIVIFLYTLCVFLEATSAGSNPACRCRHRIVDRTSSTGV